MDIEVRRTPARYEAVIDGEVAGFLEYRDEGDRRVMPHTVTEPEHGGKGVGSNLARTALDDARADGVSVDAVCPFVAEYIERHPEYSDLM